MIRPQAARRPQCAVKWNRNLKPKLAIMRQCTSVTDRRTDRRTLTSYHKREMYILHLALKIVTLYSFLFDSTHLPSTKTAVRRQLCFHMGFRSFRHVAKCPKWISLKKIAETEPYSYPLTTDRVSRQGKATSSVRLYASLSVCLSVCFYSSFEPTDLWTKILICAWVMIVARGIESRTVIVQGQELRFELGLGLGLRLSIDCRW